MGADEDDDQVVALIRVVDDRNGEAFDRGAVTLCESDAMLSQCGQSAAAGEERDLVSGFVQAGGVQGAEDAGSVDEDLHVVDSIDQ